MNYLDYTTYGIAKYVSPGQPALSIVGAQLYDLYVDKDTGIQYHCIDPTYGSQIWLGSDGSTVAPIASMLNPDLIAAYNIDDSSEFTLVDSSGKGNTGTIEGAILVSGYKGSGIQFRHNTIDKVTFADLHTKLGNTGAMAMWVNSGGISSGNAKKIFHTSSLSFVLDSGVDGTFRSAGSWEEYNLPALHNVWAFYVIQPDATNTDYEVYVNGVLYSSKTGFIPGPADWFGKGTPTFSQLGAAQLDLGYSDTNKTDLHTMDLIKFYNRRLTLAEVNEIYTSDQNL